MEAKQLRIPPIFSSKSQCKLVEGRDIVLTLHDTYMVIRTQYVYTDENGVEKSVNEKEIVLKSAVTKLVGGWDSDSDVFFFGIRGIGIDMDINIDTSERAQEILADLTDWLVGLA